jgi:hypothetical protein
MGNNNIMGLIPDNIVYFEKNKCHYMMNYTNQVTINAVVCSRLVSISGYNET